MYVNKKKSLEVKIMRDDVKCSENDLFPKIGSCMFAVRQLCIS